VPPDVVDVWRVALEAPSRVEYLSPDELARAGRFRFDRHRRRFIAARAALRAVLAGYLGQHPRKIQFLYGEHGKPHLDDPPPLEFNLAHSGELALIAVTGTHAVGVDVELERDNVADEGIAERFFSASEVAALHSLPTEQRQAAFFRCWTRKEAFLKATGKGLSFGLDQFSVSLLPAEPAALLSVPTGTENPARWSFFHLDPGTGYQAALAVRGVTDSVRLWQFG
jgi:4'-phosphopantetheinyl transferase